MNEFQRRARAMRVLLTYQEQSIGMLKAVDYVHNQKVFLATIRWGLALRQELQRLEVLHQKALHDAKTGRKPPWNE